MCQAAQPKGVLAGYRAGRLRQGKPGLRDWQAGWLLYGLAKGMSPQGVLLGLFPEQCMQAAEHHGITQQGQFAGAVELFRAVLQRMLQQALAGRFEA